MSAHEPVDLVCVLPRGKRELVAHIGLQAKRVEFILAVEQSASGDRSASICVNDVLGAKAPSIAV